METKLKKYLGYLPYLAPLVYFFGFILINGYLFNYGYSEYSILNVTYLKAGILMTIFISIIFLNAWFSFTKETMTDNLKKSWKSILLGYYNILFITYILFIYLVGLESVGGKWMFVLISSLFTLFLFLRIWTENKSPKNNIGFIVLIIPGLIILLVIDLIFAFNSQLARYLLIFNIALTTFITISLGLLGDKEYGARIITDFIFIVAFCFFFGYKIYGLLPYNIGGGKSYQIVIDNNCLNNEIERKTDTLNVLYENEDKFIFLKDSSIIAVSRDEIKCYYIIK